MHPSLCLTPVSSTVRSCWCGRPLSPRRGTGCIYYQTLCQGEGSAACRPRVLLVTSLRSGRLTGPQEGGARGLCSAQSNSPEKHAACEPVAVKPFEQNLLLKMVRKFCEKLHLFEAEFTEMSAFESSVESQKWDFGTQHPFEASV